MPDPVKLTTAQKKAVIELPDEFSMTDVNISRVTIRRLIDAGILERVAPTRFGIAIHRWTPIGSASRAHLLTPESDNG